jgi:GAF domain-containing protein
VPADREARVIEAFVALSDTLVDDFDVLEFLHMLVLRCAELFDTATAGLMLADGRGGLQVMAASAERTRLLELFELQNDEGPCLESYRDSRQVSSGNLEQDLDRWPVFAPEALASGFRAVHSFPLRLRREVIGALNVFRTEANDLADADINLAQALADVATIGLLQERSLNASLTQSAQLQAALSSRVTLEQAKGSIAEAASVEMDAAFAMLRGYARSNNRRLTDIAADIVQRRLTAEDLVARDRTSRSPRSER